MVCCAIISLIIAGLIWPLRRLLTLASPHKVSPLMWQLSSGPNPQTLPKFSVRARMKSVSYALAGLRFVILNEHNARIHIAAAGFIIFMGLILQIEQMDWAILSMAIISVWFAEIINTAFEYLCDVVSPEKNEAVKHAKDIAAGAVLITALGAIIIGMLILLPYVNTTLSFTQSGFDFGLLIENNLCTGQ